MNGCKLKRIRLTLHVAYAAADSIVMADSVGTRNENDPIIVWLKFKSIYDKEGYI